MELGSPILTSQSKTWSFDFLCCRFHSTRCMPRWHMLLISQLTTLLLSWNWTTVSFNCLFLHSSQHLCSFMCLKHGMLIRLRNSHFVHRADWNDYTTNSRSRLTEDCTCEVISSNRNWFESVIIFLSLNFCLCHSMISLLCFASLKISNLSTSKFKLNINCIASLLQNRDE
jgi:hypothetical protein